MILSLIKIVIPGLSVFRSSYFLPCIFTLQTHVYKVPVADVVAVGPGLELEASSSVLPRLSDLGFDEINVIKQFS